MTDQTFLTRLIGRWKGTCRTWFEPDKLADESVVDGEFRAVAGGPFVRHIYSGSIQGKPRQGEELIAFNTVAKLFEIAWFDDFHMSYAIQFSQGPPSADGFSVLGEYDVGAGEPRWGWRTDYRLLDDDHLTITAWNVPPGGVAAKAVETVYERQR